MPLAIRHLCFTLRIITQTLTMTMKVVRALPLMMTGDPGVGGPTDPRIALPCPSTVAGHGRRADAGVTCFADLTWSVAFQGLAESIHVSSEGALWCWPGARMPIRSYKKPAAPTPAQGLAMASLVFHGDTALLPAPFHRLGDLPPGVDDAPAVVASDDEASESTDSQTLRASFFLLAADCTPETVRIEIGTPCTVPQVLTAVLHAANPPVAELYPRLLEARPQPFSSFGVLVALPQWSRDEPVVVLDLSAIDGRCFVAFLPSPFCRQQAVEVAGLSAEVNVQIFAFGSPRPLAPDEWCDVREAGVLSFQHMDAAWVVRGTSLQLMLWAGHNWAEAPVFPLPPMRKGLCLVQNEKCEFLFPSSEEGTPQATDIAAAVGISRHNLAICFAEPAVRNALCSGWACSTVVSAVSIVNRDDPAVPSLLIDRRPLLLGWDVWQAPGGRLNYHEVIDWLDTFSPDGWHARLIGASREHHSLVVLPGSVVCAVYVPDGPSASSDSSSESAAEASGSFCCETNEEEMSRPAPSGGDLAILCAHPAAPCSSPGGLSLSQSVAQTCPGRCTV